MRRLIWVALAFSLPLAACTDNEGGSPMSTPKDRPEAIQDLVNEADLIVEGTVVSVEPALQVTDDLETYPRQTATIEVARVLKGDAQPGSLTIAKPKSKHVLAREGDQPDSVFALFAGIFVLKDVEGVPTLFGTLEVHDDEWAHQKFARVLAGLPEDIAKPSDAELADWASRADAIVVGSVDADPGQIDLRTPRVDFSTAGTLEASEVLKGTLAGSIRVARGPQPDVPGGTWGFRVGERPIDRTSGVFFLDLSGDHAVVINTVSPERLRASDVQRVLE